LLQVLPELTQIPILTVFLGFVFFIGSTLEELSARNTSAPFLRLVSLLGLDIFFSL
jgi:hypothetical protein